MTVKLYDETPYETEFSALVVKCEPQKAGQFDIILNQTLFFPEEGGQTPDSGKIFYKTSNGSESALDVFDVQIDKENIIRHRVETPIQEGSFIRGKIDWKRRFYNMQQHTGEHILSGIVNSRFGYNNVGFHLSDNDVTMDYDGVLTKDQIKEIEFEANKVIALNLPVTCFYPTQKELETIDYRSKKELEGPIRIVKIEGCDICACCAPHVRSSAEVGLIKVISSGSWKGGTRIYILCGFRALEEFNRIQDAAYEVSHEFSVPVSRESFTSAFSKQKDNISALKKHISDLEQQLLSLQISAQNPESQNIFLFTDGFSDIIRRNTINGLVKTCTGYVGIFDGNEKDGYFFIIASAVLDCSHIVNALKVKYETRGGGKPSMVQGHVNASKEELNLFFSRFSNTLTISTHPSESQKPEMPGF